MGVHEEVGEHRTTRRDEFRQTDGQTRVYESRAPRRTSTTGSKVDFE